MNPELVQYVAWYGALVATATFAFNVWKWLREGARLRVTIVRTTYEDAEVLKVEKTEHGETQTLATYYHIEVVNVGQRPCTIMGVQATAGMAGYSGRSFTPHYGKELPYVVGPGEVWSCRVRQDRVDGLKQTGTPKLQLTATCWHEPKLFAFPLVKIYPPLRIPAKDMNPPAG